MEVLYDLPEGWIGLMEGLRPFIVALCGEPGNPVAAWGALTNAALKKRWMVKTGRKLQSRLITNNAREAHELRRI